MVKRSSPHIPPVLLVSGLLALLLAACGGGGAGGGTGAAAVAADEVAVHGRITEPGTKGALLVFAFAGAEVDPAAAEPLSLAVVDAEGGFTLVLPPVEALTLAVLADGNHDGAIDGGDPVALLRAPALADLGGGELVTLDEIALDFRTRTATAGAIDVQRPGVAPANTPTPLPAG